MWKSLKIISGYSDFVAVAPGVTGLITSLAISICGGFLFSLLHIPLPWMLGSLFAVGVATVTGMKTSSIPGGRQAGQLIIGCALGQYFSPEVTRHIASFGWLIIGAAVTTLIFAWLGGLLLHRISGIDRTTAFFASVPGGAAEMAILGERVGAKFDRVALSHSLRVLMVVSTVPVILTWSGASGTDAYEPIVRQANLSGMALLLFLASLGGLLLARLKIANAWLLGPLAVSFSLTVNNYQMSSIPPLVLIIGQLLIGWALGVRFGPSLRTESYRYLLGVMASAALSTILSLLLGIAISIMYEIPMPSMVLATAPGGISEMCVTAKILKLGVPLVTSFQVARITILLTLTLPVWRMITRCKTPTVP